MPEILSSSLIGGLGQHKLQTNFGMVFLAIVIARVVKHFDVLIVVAEVNELAPIPIIGVVIYVGLISGYIPSPLYERNERWPRPYVIFQLMLLILTASRLTRRLDDDEMMQEQEDDSEDEEYEYDHDVEELTTFTFWMGNMLHKIFYRGEDGPIRELFDVLMEDLIGFVPFVVLFKFMIRYEWVQKIDESKNLSFPFVVARNCLIFLLTTVFCIWEDMNDPEGGQYNYCMDHHKVTPGWVAPNYPVSTIVDEFTSAWKTFHTSDLWLIRLSHAVLYPSILLLLTRRKLSTFFIWLLFMEIDIFHMLADMVHYVSGPSLAEDRLNFQGGAKDCYLNVYLFQTIFAYPMNFVYLSTSLGDNPQINDIVDN